MAIGDIKIQEMEKKYPVLSMLCMAVEWHSNPDSDMLAFQMSSQVSGYTLEQAEQQAAALTGDKLAETVRTDPGEELAGAEIVCAVLTAIFA